MLKILWLAPYHYEYARGLNLNKKHPAPWVVELAKEISGKVELTIANWATEIQGAEEFKRNGINFIFVASPRVRYDLLTMYYMRIKKLGDYLVKRCGDYDLIHVHGFERQYERIAQRLGIPYITSIQGIINLCRKVYPTKFNEVYARWILSSLYETAGMKKSKYFFCRTAWDSGYIKKIQPDAKIYHNWEIIREDFFTDNYDENSNNLLYIGGTSYFKGFRETLRCVNNLNNRGQKKKLRICGPGDAQKIAGLLKSENLNVSLNDIEFIGYLTAPQLVDLFKDSFCLLHPSYMDNSPNSICEAQVSGLPVVASDVGGVGSLIDNGTTGLLVKRYDHIGLADQICRLRTDKNLYARISENSRNVARKRHDREQIVGHTLKVYDELKRD